MIKTQLSQTGCLWQAAGMTLQICLQSLDVKSSNESPGYLLMSRVYNVPCHGFSAATSTGDLPKWETREDQTASVFFFPTKSMNSVLPFPLIVIWGQMYWPCKQCVSLQKDFCKCFLKAHHIHTLNMVTVAGTFKSKNTNMQTNQKISNNQKHPTVKSGQVR